MEKIPVFVILMKKRIFRKAGGCPGRSMI